MKQQTDTGGQTCYVPQEPGRVCLDKPHGL